MLNLSGPPRSGKSNLAYQMGEELDPTFGPERMCLTGNDFIQQALELPPGSCLVLDEQGEGAWSTDFMKEETKLLTKFSAICGERYLIGIINSVYRKRLTSDFRDERCLWWFLIPERTTTTSNHFKAHRAIHNPYSGSVYWEPRFTGDYTPIDATTTPGWVTYEKRKHAYVQTYGEKAAPPDPVILERRTAVADLKLKLADLPKWIREAKLEDYQGRRQTYVRRK